jgi:membrane dipeptidase
MPPGLDQQQWWPPGNEYGTSLYAEMKIVPPERLPEITEALLAHQYGEADVAKIIGGNMLRVAEQSWQPIGS